MCSYANHCPAGNIAWDDLEAAADGIVKRALQDVDLYAVRAAVAFTRAMDDLVASPGMPTDEIEQIAAGVAALPEDNSDV